MTQRIETTRDTWPEALATVLTCTYDFGAGRALIGLPTNKHFRITYNYWSNTPDGESELHTGTLTAAKPIPQGTLFPIRYNPDAPKEHRHNDETPVSTRIPLLGIGIAGSVILSLAWLAVLHGCR